MSNDCAKCTYLDLNSGDIYGKFYCEKKWERHLASDPNCSNFCIAYSRDYNTIENAYRYSNDHSNSGCYLTTILCNILGMQDNNSYLTTMRDFRKNVLQTNEQYKYLLVEYDIIGPKISELLNNDPSKITIAYNLFYQYITPIVNLIKTEQYNLAIIFYIDMVNSLKTLYKLNSTSISALEIENADIKLSGHGIYKVKKITQK